MWEGQEAPMALFLGINQLPDAWHVHTRLCWSHVLCNSKKSLGADD
jgi:hypothetical protein